MTFLNRVLLVFNNSSNIAIEGVDNYAEGQYKELDKLEEISNKIDEAIKDIDRLEISVIPKIKIVMIVVL